MFDELPRLIEIEPTFSCNLRCRMCHVSFMPDEPRPVFPAELTGRLAGLAGTEILLGSGFEPTMNKGFGQIVRTLTRLGLRIELITNGTLLDDELIAILADADIRLLVFSFDGIRRETYEHIRRRASYDRTLERILKTRASLAPGTLFALNSTVMQTNMAEVPESVAFWDQAGFDQIRFISMVVRENVPELVAESLYPVREAYHGILDGAARELIQGRRRITMTSPHFVESPLRFEYPDRFHGSVVDSGNPDTRAVPELRAAYQLGAGPGMTWPCRSPWTYARILPNADVELCFKYPIGNLRDRTFERIWFGAEATEVRRRVVEDASICPACEHYRLCLRGGSIDTGDRQSYVSIPAPAPPRLVTSLVGCNIVWWQGRYFALPWSLGEVDIERAVITEMPGVVACDSFRAAQRAAVAAGVAWTRQRRWWRRAARRLRSLSSARGIDNAENAR